jgi:hypothetical protein
MRAALVAIFVFAGLLALGHYVAAPFFCRGDTVILGLNPRALCGPDDHLSRAGSVLLYFSSVAVAVFVGAILAFVSGGKAAQKNENKQEEAKPVETFEEVVAAAAKKVTPAATSAPATAKKPDKATDEIKSALGEKAAPEKQPQPTPIKADSDPLTAAIGEAITAGLAAKKGGAAKGFDGTNQELLERFRELKKQEGVNAIAQAQRLLDESTLSALAKGGDPKQHLSQIAHLVLAEDPDLKSGVVRGVVVHIAARLKELGVAKQSLPGTAAKGAA